MKEHIIDNIICKIGKNANENWELLDKAKDHHLLFHLSSFPSCYVILECNKEPTQEQIIECARLCKNNTKYKNMYNIYVDYTNCSNLQKGSKVGEIIFKSNKKVNKIKI